MGVEIVDCPTCGEPVHIGLPMGSEVLAVEEGAREETNEETKTRSFTCPAGHAFSVTFPVG
jgi:hypothetical protein